MRQTELDYTNSDLGTLLQIIESRFHQGKKNMKIRKLEMQLNNL